MNTTNSNNIVHFRNAVAGAALAALLLNGGSAQAAGQKHHEPTGKDAFFHYQVDTTEELVAALRSSQSLRQRYARHFGIPESEVVDFVSRALVPYRLPATRTMTVYGVTRSGKIYPVTSRMKKGTKVWATRSGMPVLKWACANPLTNVMPGTRLPSPARTARTPGQARGGNVAPLGLIPEMPSATALAANLPEFAPSFAVPSVDVMPIVGAPAPLVAAAAPVAPVITAGPSGGGGNNLGSLLLIPLGIAALISGGGDDNNGGPSAPLPAPPVGSEIISPPVDTFVPGPITGTDNPPPPPPPVEQAVPEPGTIALFALAAPVAAGMLIRRRRQSAK